MFVNRGRVAPGKTVKRIRGRDRELASGQRAVRRCHWRRLNFFPLVRKVIDEKIFAEAVGAGVEGAAYIYKLS